jgi:hypothetical protein
LNRICLSRCIVAWRDAAFLKSRWPFLAEAVFYLIPGVLFGYRSSLADFVPTGNQKRKAWCRTEAKSIRTDTEPVTRPQANRPICRLGIKEVDREFGSSPSSTMIWDTSIWRTETCSPSTTPSDQGCHLSLRYVPLPMSPGRTRMALATPAGLEPATP